MKKTFLKIAALFAVVVATTTSVLAQGSFAYQAVIRDSNGELVKDKDVNAKFSLLEKGKTAAYVETQKVKTNQYGNISVMVGSGTKVSGDFNQVPWNTMSVMMKVEIDVNGGNDFKEIGEIQLQPVPYAFYAASAGSLTNNNAGGKDPIFSVKDDKGELVFAVYNDGVKVFVDDTDPSKAMNTGFAVSGRRAAKDGETNDYFVVNGKGTQVYVDEDASGKPVSTGFAVSGRRAAKDGSSDLFTVNSEGTQVYIDDASSSKPVSTGFAVSGRRAAKDGAVDNYLTINTTNGTQVYIDDDSSKPVSTGFAVSGRRAAKDGVTNDYFTIDAEGTKVYVDEEDPKAMNTGFAVAGRRAAKDGSDANLFTVSGEGTQVFIDEPNSSKPVSTGFAVSGRRAAKDEPEDFFTINTTDGTMVFVDDDPSKAMNTGFAVAGRRAGKDDEPALLLKVNGDGTQVFIDDQTKAMNTGFAVSGRRAAKEDTVINYLSITDTSTQFISDEFLIKGKGENVDTLLSMNNSSTKFKGSSFSVSDGDVDLFAVENGNVHINSDMVMSGDVEKKVDIDLSKEKAVEIKTANATQGAIIETGSVFDHIDNLSLLKIVGGSPVLVQGNGLDFAADGSIAKNADEVAIRITIENNVLFAQVVKDVKDGVAVVFGVQNGDTYTDGAKYIVTFKK